MSPETSLQTWMPGYPCRHDEVYTFHSLEQA
jgi:hypothetical protein